MAPALGIGRAVSAREYRIEHTRRAAQAKSTVYVVNIEEESAHEDAIRAALVPMGRIAEVRLMQLEGDRQSWALVTYVDEASAARVTSRAQRKSYGCTAAVRWSVRMVPAVDMLQLQLQFMPTSLGGDGGRVEMMRDVFDKGVSPRDLYQWRTSPAQLAKAQHEEAENRLLEIEALKAGKTVKQIVAPTAADQMRQQERRKMQAQRRRQVLGYEAAIDDDDGGRGWGGGALNQLVRNVGKDSQPGEAWTVPPVPPSNAELNKEKDRLQVAARRLSSLSKLTPKPPSPPPPQQKKKRRMILHLPNAVQAPTWPRSTGMGSSNPRLVFDVPHRNPYKPQVVAVDLKSSRGQIRSQWKNAIQTEMDHIAGWRREGDTIVVADPAISQLLHLCGATGTTTGRRSPPRKSPSPARARGSPPRSSGSGSPDRKSPVEDEEFRVKASLLKARTVFQKLVFYAADHPSLKPLIDELRKLQDHKVEAGPWITKLREKTAEVKMNCPDGRPSLRAVRVQSSVSAGHSGKSGVNSDEPAVGMGHELDDLNAKVDELLGAPNAAEGEADNALHMIDDWLVRHQEAGGHPPEQYPSTGPECHLLTRRSQALVMMGEDARSNLDAMKLIDIRPSNPRPHVMLAAAHIDRANHEVGQHYRAAECYLDATSIAPASVAPRALESSFRGVRLDRDYRNELERRQKMFPTQGSIMKAMEAAPAMTLPEAGVGASTKIQARKVYDWTKLDVSDLIMQQHRVRVGLLKMAGDVDGVTGAETHDLLRNMDAQQLPKPMISQVRLMCIDGEIDEDDKAVLEDLAPPERFENLRELQELLEQLEHKLLAIFRHYCYLISAGMSGLNERSDAVSPAQFMSFVADCKMLEGHDAMNKSAVDYTFLRAMFLRGGADGMGRKDGHTESEKKDTAADAAPKKKTSGGLGASRDGASHTLGSDGTQRALELYEFVGGMVRLANRRYPNMIGKGLAAKFDRFTKEILDKMEAGGIHNLEELMESREIKKVLKEYATKLTRVFEVFAKVDMKADMSFADKSSAARTINISEFEHFCEAAGIVAPGIEKKDKKTTRADGTPFVLTRHDPRECFVEVNLDDDLYEQEDAENKADEIVYDEFTECLVLLAQRQLAKRAAAVMNSPPTTFEPEEVAPELVELLNGCFTELALTMKSLRGIDRVRKEDTVEDKKEDRQAVKYYSDSAQAWNGRRAAGKSWTVLPWKHAPRVPLRPASRTDGLRARSSTLRLARETARPITDRELRNHSAVALRKMALVSTSVDDEDVAEAMKDTAQQKQLLIMLLTDAYPEMEPLPTAEGTPAKKKKKKNTKKKKKKK